jgi:hypothetical protein
MFNPLLIIQTFEMLCHFLGPQNLWNAHPKAKAAEADSWSTKEGPPAAPGYSSYLRIHHQGVDP